MSSIVRVLLLVLLATEGSSTLITTIERDGMQRSTGQENSRSQSDAQQEAMANLLAATEVVGKSQATSEGQGDEGDNASSTQQALTLAKRSPEDDASKLQTLREVTVELFFLVEKVESYSFNLTLSEFTPIFERLVRLPPSREPVVNPELLTGVSALLSGIMKIVSHLYANLPAASPGKLIAHTFPSGGSLLFKDGPNYYDKLLGYPIYSTGEFSLATTYYSDRYVSYVVYPANSSPFSPLPLNEFPITKWQCVDIIGFVDFTYMMASIVDNHSMILLQWIPTNHTPNLKYRCAYWAQFTWAYDKCIVSQSIGIPRNVSCFCDFEVQVSGIIEAGFILYAYEEDLSLTICENESLVQPNSMSGTADVSKLQKKLELLIDILDSSVNSSSYYCEYLSQLSDVMRFDQAALVTTSEDKVLKDIGTILDKVQPEGRRMPGIRNNDLASFVFDLDSYNRDPPIGFGMYRNLTYGIEYFRNEENNVDLSLLFSHSMSYSLLFSKSVVEQNSRYAFLLYPPDKFFKPAAVIDGHLVSSMRVLDIVLTSNEQGHQDQLVHVFAGIVTTNRLVGCAYWSASLNDWSSADCHPNPDLHDGVCTCNMTANFVESPTRGHYVVFTYATSFFVPEIVVDPNADKVQLRAEIAIYLIHTVTIPELVNTRDMLDLLSNATKHSVLQINKICEITHDIRTVLQSSVTELHIVKSSDFEFIGGGNPADKQTAFFCGPYNEVCREYIFQEEFLANANDISYAFRLTCSPMAESKLLLEYAYILFPLRVSFQAPPHLTGRKVASFRVIDILTSPVPNVDQYIQFYLDHPATFAIGCAFWRNELATWTPDGCNVVTIGSVNVCNCSLTENPSGGQYIVYSYSTVTFDESVYGRIGTESFTDSETILAQGAELIKNATQLLAYDDADLSTKVLRTYHKILLNVEVAPKSQEKLQEISDDLMRAFGQFYVDPFVSVSFIYDIPTFWSVKNAEVASDLYSNAVLSSGAVGSESTELSDFALAVIGHLHETADTMLHGIHFPRANGNAGTHLKTNSTTSLAEENPLFACFVTCSELFNNNRFIFTVYPLNLSPYPYTMTNHPMFNSRQVDIYVDKSAGLTQKMSQDSSKCDMIVQVYFQPTENPKSYVKIGCSAWNKTGNGWSDDVCTVDLIVVNRILSCSCNLTDRSVTSVIMYEYTDLVNFSLVTLFEGPSVVFIVGASFSLIGFIIIAMTAILFPSWREELGNKVLMHLAASSFLYLCMTMFRETHLIFADMKRLDLALVAFTVCVHYTRLVHHCWGLVMSVLQYRKFSTLAGASTTSHLLLKISLLAWGVPVGPLVLLLSWDVRAHFCSPDKLTHYILYLVPVVVITLLNLGLLAAIIYNMTNGCGRWVDDELKKHGGSSKDVLKRQLKQMVMMFFLFGIPTVFEMFNDIASHSVTLDYIDKILNPIQGFVMFLFFVVMNDKTRGLWIGGVFGDAPVAVNPPPSKKVVFKSKNRKIVKKPAKSTEVIGFNAEAKPFSSAKPEIQIITSGAGSGLAVKYVAQRGDATASHGDSCAEGEGENAGSDKKSGGRDNLAPSDVATLDLEPGTNREDERDIVDNELADNDIMLRCVSDLSKMFAVFKKLTVRLQYGDDKVEKSQLTARELVSHLRNAADELELLLNGTKPK